MKTNETLARVMLVDDEENVIKAIRRELESTGRFEVTGFSSPELALINAADHHYDLLLADYRMPWMHGLTFMGKFKALQPQAVAIIISGDADRALSHSEFNEIEIPYLLRKPWKNDELIELVDRALAERGPGG